MYRVWNVRSSDINVNKTPYNMTITSKILKMFTISGDKVNIELHRSLSSPVISKRSTIKKILNILFLRQKELRRGGDLNPKYCRGSRSDIRNWSLRWVLTKTIYSGSSPVIIMSFT
jgi:hypothetical protein